VINKKKKEEFVQICTQDNKAKILFLQGPSGCGKNSMIDAFGEQYNYEVIRYTDQKSKNVIDVYGAGDTFGNEFGDRD
jgi:putative ribosome biogenesis GTPase RsgA